MNNEDISQSPEKLRALALERGGRIERLEGALRWYAGDRRPEDFLNDMGCRAREALADDGAGGETRRLAQEIADKQARGELNTEPVDQWAQRLGREISDAAGDDTPNRDALEALDRIAERAIRAARGKEPEITDDYATVGEFIRRAFTAPPTVPEAVRRLPEEWRRRSDPGGIAGAQRRQDAAELERTLAQHSEPENDDDS